MAHCRKTQLSVLLNNFCNLSCLYCYVGRETGKKKEQISLEFAKRGILDFLKDIQVVKSDFLRQVNQPYLSK
jgi:hypothetical protein